MLRFFRKRQSLRGGAGARVVCAAIALTAIGAAYWATTVNIQNGRYSFRGSNYIYAGNLALSETGSVTVNVDMHVGLIRPSLYTIDHDDCIARLTVNGVAVISKKECHFPYAALLNLGPFLKTGTNHIEATVTNTSGGMSFHLSVYPYDPLAIAAVVVATLSLILFFSTLLGGAWNGGWTTVERLFLCSFLALRVMELYLQWGHEVGFDLKSHIEYMRHIDWNNPLISATATGYSYHPPLGFLLPELLYPLGFSEVGAIHAVSAAFGIVAFVALRATLSRLGLLRTATGIAFLYFTSSLPIIIFLARSVNIDSHILAYAAVTLYLCIRIFVTTETRLMRFLLQCACGIVIALAMMTKASGLLLFALPLLVISVEAFHAKPRLRRTEWKHWLAGLAVIGAVSSAYFLPYYIVRYYEQKGAVIFLDGMPKDYVMQNHARAERDKDRVGFVTAMFLPTSAHQISLNVRDRVTPRLSDTWKDIWMKDEWLGKSAPAQRAVGTFYWTIAPLLLLVGAAAFARTAHRPDAWSKLGLVFGGFAALQLLALIAYVYRMPWGIGIPSKAIYIAPAAWAIGFLAASATTLDFLFEKKFKAPFGKIALCLVAAFMVLNHVLPVY